MHLYYRVAQRLTRPKQAWALARDQIFQRLVDDYYQLGIVTSQIAMTIRERRDS
jgi:hypothetical protein